jgi:hypothetical protein
MAISYHEHATSPEKKSFSRHPSEITLGMTQSMAATLDGLSEEMDAPVEEVLSQAVALLMVAVEAQNRGQRLCLADDDLNIVGEIVDFGASNERIGVDPFPEAESGRIGS